MVKRWSLLWTLVPRSEPSFREGSHRCFRLAIPSFSDLVETTASLKEGVMPALAHSDETTATHSNEVPAAFVETCLTEFDLFSSDYDELVKDPICDWFAESGRSYFHLRKREVILQYFQRLGCDTRRLSYLDVGCGRGELLKLMHSDFRRVCGCDPSVGMLSAGELTHNRIEISVQDDSTRLPYANAEFDFVTAVCVYHHVAPELRPSVTAELARVLKPGGIACVIEHNPANPMTRLVVSQSPVDANTVLLPVRETCGLFQEQGFSIDWREYFLYVPERFSRMFGWLERSLSRVPLGGQYAMFARLSC